MGSHKVRQALVRQRQRHDDALRHDASPPLGQMPEGQEKTIVDALVMGDRERHRQVVRSAGATGKELDAELRPRIHPHHEPVIEHGEPSVLEDDPTDFRVDM